MKVQNNFGDLKKGMFINIISDGRDWKKVKHRGYIKFVPSWVFERDTNTYYKEFESSLLEADEE